MPKPAPAPAQAEAPVIVVVEDDVIVRHALRDMLEEDGFQVEDYGTGEAFLAAFTPGRAACLLIDAALPGLSGVEVLQHLKGQDARLPSIMITGSSDVKVAVEAMKAGAVNFVQKPFSPKALTAEIRLVIEQSRDTSKAKDVQQAASNRLAGLTRRQQEVLRRVLDGQPNKNIAADLHLSQRTVENHRAAVMKKTGARSLPDLTRMAFSAALIEGEREAQAPEEASEALQGLAQQAGGLETDQLGRYFDQIPLAIIIAEIGKTERIVYANPAYERLSGQPASELHGKPWDGVAGQDIDAASGRSLGHAITSDADCVGTFKLLTEAGDPRTVEAYSNIIADDDSKPVLRLAALVDVSDRNLARLEEFQQKILEKDALLLEIQHRVKNNLQMITALIRAEARTVRDEIHEEKFNRLAGRINSIQIAYRLLSDFEQSEEIDLGVYLSAIASSVMQSHAIEGISLDLKVDTYPVSVNVALPTGLVANELLTNALKHAFVGRAHGTITLHSVSDPTGCRVVIADDGVGLPPGANWPKRGKLGELIVRSLRQNAKAELDLASQPGKGTRVTIRFARAAAQAGIAP